MSNRVAINSPAPEFTLANWQGKLFSLSNYRGQKHVVLVLNRGFV